jgi:Na+-translocating ferredoxin:NAD+ oxidoreductase subunit B
MSAEFLVQSIDAVLPQTQCQRCGYADCYAYAQALAEHSADLNQCPPGGDETITALARLLRCEPKPLNPAHGQHAPRAVAVIDETVCIGCTRCILACPVDAILGATKLMHSVIAEECTGCELCIPPCPVDCIVMMPAARDNAATKQMRAESGRRRHHFRAQRLARDRAERSQRQTLRNSPATSAQPELDARRLAILAAVERARVKRKPSGE